jgi:hypothetical protein
VKDLEGCGMEAFQRNIYSDECYIFVDYKKGHIYVMHRADEEYHEDCLAPAFPQSNIRIMIWSCIGLGIKGPIIVMEYQGGKGGGISAETYKNQVLEPFLKDFFRKKLKKKGKYKFQHDGAPGHRAKATRKWFADHGIALLPHPANSPDLNPIKTVWFILKDIF